MKRPTAAVACLSAASLLLLAACGGGGGGGGGSSWLTFQPSSLSATMAPGDSKWVSLVGVASSVPDAQVSIGVLVDTRVFDQATEPEQLDDMTYAMSLRVKSTLAAGTYTGNIQVRVCLDDDPIVCSRPYRGSPWNVPFKVTVLEPDTTTVALDFEGDQVARWLAADDLVASGGEASRPLAGVTFAQDTAIAQAGSASLSIAGPLIENYWGTDYVIDLQAFLHRDRSPVDFTGRTLSAYFHLGAGASSVGYLEVAVVDDQGRPSQGVYTAASGETWQRLTFNPGADETNYVRPGFDITRVQSVVLRISGAGPVGRVEWNVDSITW